MKKLLFIALAAILALSVSLVGCGEAGVTYTLVISSGSGGHVTTPGQGTFEYTEGRVVNLVATAYAHSAFDSWTGNVGTIANVTDPTTTITMNGNYSIQANFVEEPWTYEIPLQMHLTVPNSFVSLASKVYIPWAAEVNNHIGSVGGSFCITITYGSSPFGSEDSLYGISHAFADIGQLSADTFDLGTIGYLPFMFPNLTSTAYTGYTILHDEVATWDELGQLEDVVVLLVSPLHGANWISDDYNVTAPGQIAGLNVRAEAGEIPTVQNLSAIAKTNIDISALAGAISGGTVDGAFVTYSAMLSFGLVPVINYTTQLGLFPRLYSLAINKDVYDALPTEAKAWLDSCCTIARSVYWAQQHANAEGYYKSNVASNLSALGKPPIYVCNGTCRDAWVTATAGVKTTWAADMNTLGYDGTGLLAQVEALVAAAP